MAPSTSALDKRGLVHLCVIFVIWGSTYLAIRVAVADGGFAPMWMGALRTAAAGGLLLGFAWLRGHRLRLPAADWPTMALGGLLVWSAGNGLVMIAEVDVPSSVAALVAAMTPAFVALFEAVIERRLPKRNTWLAVGAGSLGVALLQRDLSLEGAWGGPIASLLFAAACFAAGMVLHKRLPVRAPVSVRAGWELSFATFGFVTLAFARNETFTTPTPGAWAAFVYLVVFGSIIGFTSFVRATELLPTAVVSTHAFVNPVIAVLLGYLLLDEALTMHTAMSAALIVASVTLVFRAPVAASSTGISATAVDDELVDGVALEVDRRSNSAAPMHGEA